MLIFDQEHEDWYVADPEEHIRFTIWEFEGRWGCDIQVNLNETMFGTFETVEQCKIYCNKMYNVIKQSRNIICKHDNYEVDANGFRCLKCKVYFER